MKKKTILVIISVVYIAASIIILSIYKFEEYKLKKIEVLHGNLITYQMTEFLEREFNDKFVNLQIIAHSPEIVELLDQSNEEFSKYNNTQKIIDERDTSWTSVPEDEITPFMAQIIDSKVSDIFRKLMETEHDTYGEIFLTNQYGALVVASDKTTDYRQDDENWWQSTKSNSSNIDDIEYDSSSKILGNKISLKLNNEDGNMIGIIAAVVNHDVLDEFIGKSITEFNNAHVVIRVMTEKGMMLYSTKEYEFLDNVSQSKLYRNITQKHGNFEIGTGDNYKMITYSILDAYGLYPGTSWYVITEMDQTEHNILLNFVLNIMILSSIIATIAAFVSTRYSQTKAP